MSVTARRLLALALVALGVALGTFVGRRMRRDDPIERVARDLASHAAIARANETLLHALQNADAHAYAGHFADDALSMPGYGPIVRGREAITAAMAHTFTKLRFAEANVSTIDTRRNGETVIETGRYRYVVVASESGRRQTLTGRYVVVWKRVGDRWKIAMDAAQPGAVDE